MNRKKQRKARAAIDAMKDNSKLFGTKEKSAERLKSDRDHQAALMEEMHAKFKAELCAVGRTREDVLARFAAFKRQLRKKIKDRELLRQTFDVVNRAQANFVFVCSLPQKQKPEDN